MGKGILPQTCQHRACQAFTLVGIVNGNALENMILPGAGGNDLAVFPYQYSCLQILIGFQSGPGQKILPKSLFLPLQAVTKLSVHSESSLSGGLFVYYTTNCKTCK